LSTSIMIPYGTKQRQKLNPMVQIPILGNSF
jgi:hypothetical protein